MSLRPKHFAVCQFFLPGDLLVILAHRVRLKGPLTQRPQGMLAIFKEVFDYEQFKKKVCDTVYSSRPDIARNVPCGAGAAESMLECVPTDVYECGEGVSRRSCVLSRRTCSSSGLCPKLRTFPVIYPIRPMHLRHESRHRDHRFLIRPAPAQRS